jgi:hypothetical protein
MHALQGVVIRFVPEVETCPLCGERLLVYKTTASCSVVTLKFGKFQAIEEVRYCRNRCKLSNGNSVFLYRSEFLKTLVAPYHNYGFDVVAKVGILRFIHCRQREEIQSDIENTIGVSIPESSIQTIIGRFMDAVREVHEENTPKLRKRLENDGGYILHVDGTCEEGSHVHFVCLTGSEPIVLWSEKIETENAVQIQRVLKEVDKRFGKPAAAVQDLSSAIRKAVLAQWPGLPIFYCHYHFLADVGKDILDDHYKEIRNLLRKAKIKSKLNRFLKNISREIGENRNEARLICNNLDNPEFLKERGRSLKASAIAAGTAEWILSAKNEGTGRGFPYDMVHLNFCFRAQRALSCLDQYVIPQLTGRTPRGEKLLMRLRGILYCFFKSRKLVRTIRETRENNVVFTRLRNVLRLAAKDDPGGMNKNCVYQNPEDVRKAEEAVINLHDEFRKRLDKRISPQVRRSIKIVLGHLDKYWDGLFGHCLNISNSHQRYLMVQRTNNRAECFFRSIKRIMRRITGKKKLNREVDALPGHAFLTLNLKSQNYVELVCGSLDHLPEAFAKITRKGKFPKTSAGERKKGFLDRKNRKKTDFAEVVGNAYAME